MINRYAKKCCWCGVMVDAYEGRAWNYKGRWYVGCKPCVDEKFAKEDKEEDK